MAASRTRAREALALSALTHLHLDAAVSRSSVSTRFSVGAMLSIEKLAAGREGYYVRAVAYGVEDYYPRSGEVPGRWVGSASSRLGLSGEVDGDDFRVVLSGVDPRSGERLRRANGRVDGLDFTFSAPKSVSIVWALGGAELSDVVIAAHEHAVDAALEYLEREAVRSRRGRNGVEVLDGDGLVGAAFRHRTSRAGDPQLHTHVVIANTTRCCDDGVWRALDGRHLYAHAQAAGYLYQAELRRGLCERLGVEWGPVTKGCAELVAPPRGVLEEFSRRRRQIEDAAHDAGDTSIRARRRFAVTTRTAKDHEVDGETLTADWQWRAAFYGVDQAMVEGWCRPPRAPTHRPHPAETGLTHDRLAEILTEHQTTFDRRDVLLQLAHHAHQGASVAELEARAEAFLAGPQLVPVGVALTGVRYTTDELIAVEEHLVTTAEARREDGVAVCHQVGATLEVHSSLSADQRTMVETITTDGAGVSVVVGAAGTGKTFALAAARRAWHAENYRMFGCALAARAAAELQTATGIPSSSLDLLLSALDRPDSPGLERRSVVVVDEAAMVGTRKLARLLDHAHAAHAKVVLVGDHHQLPEIEAGGAFAALAHRLDAIKLADNRRQHDPIERATSTALRHSDTNRALALLAGHGRLHQHRGGDETREQIVSDWLDAILEGRDTIMLTATRADAADLNRRARRLLRAEGAISDQFLDVAGHDFAIGDHVMTLRNDYRDGLLNGQRGTVIAIGHFSRTLTVEFDEQTPTIPATYLDQGHLDHAYAMTIHKSQGLTCDVALVLVDERLHREAAYTALTRGRHENHLYLADEPDEHAHDWHEPDDEHDTLRRALQRSQQQTFAIDQRTRPSQSAERTQRAEPAEPDLDNGIDLGL